MPQDIEKAFEEAQFSLFPEKLKDLETECSCPDWSNPCKHIAAVYYLLGEEFDRDPFLIFKLRGLSREELIRRVEGTHEESRSNKGQGRKAVVLAQEAKAIEPEPLTSDVACFWNGGELPVDLIGEVRIPPIPAALLKRLGSFPFWRGKERFLDALEPVYSQASGGGLEVFLGERKIK
jgi:uncharacterized Zn finger protein